MQYTINDPANLSSLYFDPSSVRKLQPFVASDAFEILALDETRGRGMVATRDIQEGTCLFVIPPTVSVSVVKVLKEWKKRGGGRNDPSMLEAAADDVLLQEMRLFIQDDSSPAVANSFLVLEGSSASSQIPSMVCLLALEQNTALIRADPSNEELMQIIRRNAFGPDFVSYQSILVNLPKRPQRILGIYPMADMSNHSCQPNTVRVYVGEYMVVHTCTKIAKGEEITTSYVPPTFCYPQRQDALQRTHGFACSCQRCRVEAEFWNNPGELIRMVANMQQEISTNDNVLDVVQKLDDTILPSIKPNELHRYLRLGFVPMYTTYLNQALANKLVSNDEILRLCMQLHFSFVAGNPSCTEHLSILHLGYELISSIHNQSGNDTSKTLPKVKFWTEQVKVACMTRYGKMGNDLDAVRKIMQHTRLVLRTQDGMQRASYPFI
jgi:hypothetical protein